MAHKYAATEIVELGVQIERNGLQFYTILAENAANSDVAEIFRFLGEEEEKHIGIFQKILGTVQSYEPQASYPEEYFSYLHEIASEHVFTQVDKGAEVARTITGDVQAIDVALKFEDDSIRFFDAMKKIVPSDQNSLIDQLIEQEKKHVEKLQLLKSIS